MTQAPAYCASCGATLEPGASFCAVCGANVREMSEDTSLPSGHAKQPPPAHVKPAPPRLTAPVHARHSAPRQAPSHVPPPRPVSATPKPKRAAKGPAAAQGGSSPPLHAAHAPTFIGGIGRTTVNVAIFALVWAIAWGLGDIFSFVVVTALRDGDLTRFDPVLTLRIAVAGGVGGALGALLLALPYFGASVGGAARILFTLVYWMAMDVVVYFAWVSLDVSSTDEYLVVHAFSGLVYGIVFSITLQWRKPRWGLLKVPIGAMLLAVAVVVGRDLQLEMPTF